MTPSWLKFAILGSTYARALENAAVRSGRNVEALRPGLSQIAAQPQAKLKPGLSSMMREPGALPMTPQRQSMQDLAQHMPWAGEEHTTDVMSAKAPARFDRLLESRGLTQTTPGGHAALQHQINQSFGDPAEFRRSLYRADQTQTNAPAPQQTGASSPAAMRARSAQPMRGEPTSVLPTPAAPAAPPPRQFPRARFQMGKQGAARFMIAAPVLALSLLR
jgi:hypothetical protein